MSDLASLDDHIRKALGDPDDYLVPTGITRYDHRSTHGWWVRIHRDKAKFNNFFSDSVHRSIDNALIAALEHRHTILDAFGSEISFVHARTLPTAPMERIHRNVDKAKGEGEPYAYWMAVWYDKTHKRRTKSFAVKKFGEETARALALRAAELNHNVEPKVTRTDVYKKYYKWAKKSRADVAQASSEFIPYQSQRITSPHQEILEAEPFAHEGERFFQLHLAIERDRTLREAKLADHLSKHERIFCEICRFNFLVRYPFLTCDIIQVHHVTPLSELTESSVTRLSDLMLLCANCHFAVHQGDPVANVIHAFDSVARDC